MIPESREPASPPVPENRYRLRLDPDRPYPGPASFEESYSAFFFGRAAESAALFSRVERSSLTVLYAKSGLGKTSLMQAGLFPKLRRAGFVPVSVRFIFPGEKPPVPPPLADKVPPPLRNKVPPPLIDQVRTALLDAITRGDLDGAPPEKGESLWAYLFSTRFWDARGEPAVPVLVFDQFEEVFTLGEAVRAQLDELVAELSDLVEDRIPATLRLDLENRKSGAKLPPPRDRPAAKVLIALREEFLGPLDRLAPKLPSLGSASSRFPLDALSYKAAMEAVLEPAKIRSLIGKEAADKLVRAVAREPVRPAEEILVESALLALYCHELNEKRIAAQLPSISDKLIEDNQSIILDDFYTRCLAAVGSEKRTLAQRLVEEKLVIARHRQMYPMAALDQIGHGKSVLTDDDVTPLIEKRLLRKGRLLDQDYLELIHDVLIEAVEKRRKLRKQQEALQARHRTFGKIGLGAAAVLVLIGVGFVWRDQQTRAQKNAAQEARKAKIEEEIVNHRDSSRRSEAPVRTAMIALDWSNVARTMSTAYEPMVKARIAYRGAIQEGILLKEPETGPLLALLTSRFRATKGDERSLGVRAPDTDFGSPCGLVVSDDGGRGAVAVGDRSVRLFDARSSIDADDPGGPAAEKGSPTRPTEVVDWFSRRIDKLLLSGDGGRLFGVGSNGVIVVWDAQSGHLLLRFRTDLSSRLVAGMSINASPSFQVDWRGERALVWDRDANRALVISLKKDVRDWTVSAPLPTSVIDLASQGAQRSTPDAAGGWGAGRWSTLQMTPDGKRVVGTWAQRKKEGDGGRTDVRVWSVDDREVKAVASGASEDFAAVRGELSSDGALLAALGPKGLYVWALAATEIGKPPRSLPLPVVDTRPPQLMSFDASVPSLFVSAGKSLFSWSSSTEKPTRLPDHEGGVYGARLSTDGQSVLVYSGKLVERCDAATGRLISDFMAARPPDSLFLGLGADKMGVAWWTRDELRVRPFALEAEGDRYLSSTAADWDPVAGSPVIVDQILGEHGGYVVHDTPEVPGGLSLVNLQSAPGEQPAAAVAIRGATQDVVTVLVAGGRVVLTSSSGDVHAGSLKGKPTKIAHISVNDDPSLVVLSADGRWLTTPSRSGISIWDERGVNRRTVQFPLARTASLKKIAIASDGPQQARLVAADSEGHVFSARTGESGTQLLVEELTPKEREEHLVSVLAISPKGVVSVGGIDGTIALWDRSGRPYPASARAIQGSSISDLRFVKGGDLLVSASTEGTDRVWDASDGTLRCTMRDQPEGVSTVQIESEGGARILSVGEKDAIVWSAEDCVTSLHFDGVSHVGFVPGGRDRFLVVSSQFREDRGTLVEARASGDATAGGPRGRITWGAFAGESTLIAGDTVGQLFSWNVKDAANPPVRLGAPMPGDPLIAQAANRIVALMPGGELRTIDSLSKTEAAQLPMDAGWTARSIALTKDGASLFAAESSKGSLRFRRFDGPLFGVASDPVPLPTGTVCAVDERFARDPVVLVATLRGAPLVLAIEKTCLRMWSAEGKLVLEKVMTLQGDPISAALSPTTNHLAIALDSGLAFWELTNPSAWDAHVVKLVASSDLLSSSRRRERTRTIRFHPDGRFMVTTSNSGVALLWEWDEAAGGQGEVYLLAPLEPNAGLSWATFSPDGDELATGGKQGRIKLWDTSTHVDLDKTLAWLKPWLAKAP